MTPEQQAMLDRYADPAPSGLTVAQQAMLDRYSDQPPASGEGETGMVEQSMSGVNEGIGGLLGFPVDAVTSAINGAGQMMGRDKPLIENPVGGSDWFKNGILAPTISDTQPQNAAQRYARRVGQEAGAMVIPGGAMLRGAAAPMRLAGMEAASAVGAGVAGQTSQEVAPGNSVADFLASVGGSIAPMGVVGALTRSAAVPTMDDLRARQSAAYDVVDQSPAQLTDAATQQLQQALSDRAAKDGMDPFLAPKASRTAERINTMQTPRIGEVEKSRRLVGRDVAGALDPTESAIGMGMKDEITRYLDSLTPQDVTGGDPSAAVAALAEGRDMTRRIKKSVDIDNRLYKAENRAATSGTGGNEVNAIRQNIRQILDDPRKKRNYSADEVAAMETIVRGTPTQNALRLMGRFSPTSGALPAFAGVGAGTMFGPMGAIPSVVGLLAKGGAEALTKKSVVDLGKMVRNGGPVTSKKTSDEVVRGLVAAVLAQQANAAP